MNAKKVNELKKLHSTATNPKQFADVIMAQFEVIDNLTKINNNLNRAFELEKRCKNQAYYFILSNKHFDSFSKYNEKNPM
jgi:hypothetical protein